MGGGGLCLQSLCSTTAPQPTPASPGDSPQPSGRSSPSSCGVTALFWVPGYRKLSVHHLGVEFLSPPVLGRSCTPTLLVFKAKCWRHLLALPDCQVLEPEVGSELVLLWETSGILLFSSLWVSQPAGMGFDYIVKVPLLPSHGFFISWLFLDRFQAFLLIVFQPL